MKQVARRNLIEKKFGHLGSLVCAVALLAACGGDGGGGATGAGGGGGVARVVTGTAAAGAPLIGFVEVKDSAGATKKVTIGSNGAYSLDLSGLTAPYMLKAEGAVGDKAYTIYSAITADDFGGTVNVTTLSDVIVGNVAGMTAAAYYAASPTDFSKFTTANLAAAEAMLQQSLQDVINATGVTNPLSVDLLHTAFVPNNTGLDLLLDVLQVTIDPVANTATITNTAVSGPGAVFVDSLANKTDSLVIAATGMPLADLAALPQLMATLQDLFKTTKPAANDPALLALFDQGPSGFLWSGRDLQGFLALLTDPNFPSIGIGFQVTQMVFTPLNAPVTATAQVVITLPAGDSLGREWSFAKDVNGVWKAQGDGRITFSAINAKVKKRIDANGTITIDGGLSFSDVTDESQAQNISYAVVTGKGLPSGGAGRDGNSPGLLLVKNPPNVSSSFYVAQSPYQGVATPVLNPSVNYRNMFYLADATIATFVDNEPYGFSFYSDNGTPTNTTDDVLLQAVVNILRKPLLTAAVQATVQFATVTGPGKAGLVTYANGGTPVTVTWTTPSGYSAEYVEVVRGTNMGAEANPQGSVAGTAVSRVLDPLSPLQVGETVNAVNVGVSIFDVPGRYYDVTTQYNVP